MSANIRRIRTGLGIATTGVVLLVTVVVAIGVGPIDIPVATTKDVILQEFLRIGDGANQLSTSVVMNLRIPRVLAGVLIGAALAVSGAALQSLFRNPLADPSIIGVSSGAAAGAVGAVVLLPPLGTNAYTWVVPFSAFLTGLLATALIYLLAGPKRGTGTARLLLVGIAIGSGFLALTGFFTFVADDDDLQTVVFWQMGSLGEITWPKLALMAPPILIGVAIMIGMNRQLDVLTLGEREASHLGLNVGFTRGVVVTVAALMTSAAVAFAGTIGFIGLVVPHIARMMFGPMHRVVLPISALLGGLLIVVADAFARTLAPPAEIPIGLFTALFGAPFFLLLVVRSKQVQT